MRLNFFGQDKSVVPSQAEPFIIRIVNYVLSKQQQLEYELEYFVFSDSIA